MKLWVIAPCLLDEQGLINLWNDAIKARELIKEGGCIPELYKFKKSLNPIDNINWYLFHINEEASNRGLSFNYSQIEEISSKEVINITINQIYYEFCCLLIEYHQRNLIGYSILMGHKNNILLNPCFRVVEGSVDYSQNVNYKALQLMYTLFFPTLNKGPFSGSPYITG